MSEEKKNEVTEGSVQYGTRKLRGDLLLRLYRKRYRRAQEKTPETEKAPEKEGFFKKDKKDPKDAQIEELTDRLRRTPDG